MSKKELAVLADLTPGYISLLTRGGREAPSEDTLKALAMALNLDAETELQFFEAARNQSSSTSASSTVQMNRYDRGEAPTIPFFFGRIEELAKLQQWMLVDYCRLVTVLGIGGVGKTALVSKLIEAINNEFDYVFWRSLQSIPLLKDILSKCILFISNQRIAVQHKDEDDQISVLIECLRNYRCLLILDNFESVLQGGNRAGQYREGYEGYGSSCLEVSFRTYSRAV